MVLNAFISIHVKGVKRVNTKISQIYFSKVTLKVSKENKSKTIYNVVILACNCNDCSCVTHTCQ